jgi:hypothetical protein
MTTYNKVYILLVLNLPDWDVRRQKFAVEEHHMCQIMTRKLRWVIKESEKTIKLFDVQILISLHLIFKKW